jgi:hypothetical protein
LGEEADGVDNTTSAAAATTAADSISVLSRTPRVLSVGAELVGVIRDYLKSRRIDETLVSSNGNSRSSSSSGNGKGHGKGNNGGYICGAGADADGLGHRKIGGDDEHADAKEVH